MKTKETFTSLGDQLNRIVASNYNAKCDNKWADTIKEYFKDYEHVASIQGVRYPDWVFLADEVEEWCDQHCQGDYSYAIHRVSKEDSNIIDPMSRDERLYFAFKHKDDHMMFVLTWL
jgi:NAD(P)H-flavin reductase